MLRHPEQSACESVRELLEPFVDGELSERRAAWVERHVATCPGCAEEADLARGIRAALL